MIRLAAFFFSFLGVRVISGNLWVWRNSWRGVKGGGGIQLNMKGGFSILGIIA